MTNGWRRAGVPVTPEPPHVHYRFVTLDERAAVKRRGARMDVLHPDAVMAVGQKL